MTRVLKVLIEKYSVFVILAPLLTGFLWLQSQVQSILPAVMQDEYVYSMQARKIPLADLDYPNYLYALVFSSTNECGINYYSCTKNLNLAFFAGFVALIFFIANHFLGKWWAALLSTATLVSPLGAYTSLFMPESMYFFFALLSIVVLWRASEKAVWWQYLVAGVSVGLTALVKPHALFLAAGVVLYLLVVHWKKWSIFGLSVLAFVGGTLASKFSIGFLLAGVNGLTLFGSNYTSSFTSFTEDLRSSGVPEGFGASGDLAAKAAGAGQNLVLDFAGQTLFQFAWQAGSVFLLAGGLISLTLGWVTQAKTEDDAGERRFAQLVLILLGSMVAVIAAFAAMVTLMGDDHSDRLLLRYYEFLLAPLAIVAISAAKRMVTGNPLLWIMAGVFGLGGVGAFLVWHPSLRAQFADSPIMMGITSSEFAGALAVALAIALTVAVFLKGSIRVRSIGTLVAISFGAFGLMSLQRLHAQASDISAADSAGIFARDYLANAPSESIFFLGANKQLTLVSMFWLDKPEVRHATAAPLDPYQASGVPEGVEWIVSLDGTRVDMEPRFVISGQGWKLLNVSASERHEFNQAMIRTPIESTSGFGPRTEWGQWIEDGQAAITFRDPVPAGSEIELEVLVGVSGAGQILRFEFGDGVSEVQLPEAGTLARINLAFENSVPAQTLKVIAPEGSVDTFAIYSLEIVN